MILTGKSGGKPTFGCPFCSASSPYMQDGELYTLGDLLELYKVVKYNFDQHYFYYVLYFYQNFVEAGSVKKTQQRFQNVTNQPLLTGDVDDKVLGILAVPELHLLLGTEMVFTLKCIS
jgi:hypothetical protein